MKLVLDLPEEQSRRLEAEAGRMGLRPEDLVRIYVNDALLHPREDFERAAAKVLKKNENLYRKLA